MDNLDLYLYILIGIIYLVSRALKGQKKPVPQRPMRPAPGTPVSGDTTAPEPAPPRPFSFEDLLREFERQVAPPEPEEKPLTPVEKYPAEEQHYPVAPSAEYASYEGQSLEQEAYPMYYQESELQNIAAQAEQDKPQSRRKRNFGRLLRHPSGVRDAVVLSEILQRKHF
jgi:hypothetical protein